MTDKHQLKDSALEKLGRILPGQAEQLKAIDPRLLDYYEGLQDPTVHNLYEILGGLKFLRILRTYPFNQKKVTLAIKLYEGEWRDGHYVEGSGGLQFSGLRGYTHYQLQPFQLYALAGLLGPQREVDGDMRRLCTELVLFLTRKSGKTLMAAFINFFGFFFFDSNYEGYCCANSADQAKILYRTSQLLIRQMDPKEQRIRFTASQTNWKVGQPRQASFTALSSGGKTKDGLFAQACFADEFGSADFTNGKSDMLDLVNVVMSSTGPRREPLLVITTTAGHTLNGPFINQKLIIEQDLEHELDYADDMSDPQPDDFRHALLLQPDQWEQTNEELLLTSPDVWKKANPMIGVSVQPSFYEQEAHKALKNADNRKEFITKLVNVYQSDLVEPWKVTADKVRRLQVPMRIGDCRWDLGWRVFVGLDFGGMDDLWASSFFAVNYADGLEMKDRFFCDCEAWVVEADLQKSPNRPLYEQWISEGWLHVCPGDVFDSNLAVNDIIRKAYPFSNPDGTPDYRQPMLDYRMFSYDPAQSRDPINQLKAWLQSLFQAQGLGQRDIVERIKSMVVPCSQSFMTMNPIITQLETYVLTPWLRFSNSPLWPWQAGNAMMVTSRDDTLKKIIKSKPQNKVDNLHALLDAIYGYELSEGNISQE